jgi:hypothetical protein
VYILFVSKVQWNIYDRVTAILSFYQFIEARLDIGIFLTLQGRLKLATRIGEYQKVRFDRVRGQCDLIYHNNMFYLAVTIDAPENKSEYDPVGALVLI